LKIFVVGSRRHLKDDNKKTKSFDDFCTALGERFARKRWTVLAGSVASDTADYSVLKGMSDAVCGDVTVDAHIYRNERIDENTFPKYRLRPHTEYANMTVAHIAAISAADVVVVIGGQNKTPGAAWAGIALGKPVIPLRRFGGKAEELWQDLHHGFSEPLKGDVYNALSGTDTQTEVLCEKTVSACEMLLEAARKRTFLSKETIFYVVLGAVLGIAATFLSAAGGPLDWWRAVGVTVLSVLAGWLLGLLIAGEKKNLLLTFPDAVALILVILAVVGLGGKMFEDIIDKAKADNKSAQLLFCLVGAGLLSGFSARTELVRWLNVLRKKVER